MKNSNLQNDAYFDITRETVRAWKKRITALAVQCFLPLLEHLTWSTFLQEGLELVAVC